METRKVKLKQIKESVYDALDKPFEAGKIAKFFGIVLLVLILINALAVFLGVDSKDVDTYPIYNKVIFYISLIVFLFEYTMRIWTADVKFPHLKAYRARLRYILSPMGIIDLLSFMPRLISVFVPELLAISAGDSFLRLLRLVKLTRYMKGVEMIHRVLTRRKREIVAAFAVLFLFTIATSILMFELESKVQPDKFDSALTCLYWAITTITATGYGDLVPITPLGRLLGSATMFLSIAVVAIPGGIFSAGFVDEFRREREDESLN